MTRPDPYAARHAFFALASPVPSPRSILTGLLAVVFFWILAGALFFPWPLGETGSVFRTLVGHAVFLVLAGATLAVTHRLQNRNPLGLIGDLGAARGDFLRVVRTLAILLAVLYVLFGWAGEGTSLARAPLAWAALLPVACIGVLIQTGAEEILYRGYLQQSIGAVSDNPAFWMVLPSVLFGLSHYDPAVPFDAALSHMIWTGAFGLAAADLTARTGSLGAAIGLHFAYNLPLVALVSAGGRSSRASVSSIIRRNWPAAR